MKKLLILFIIFTIILSLFTLPIFSEEIKTTKKFETTEKIESAELTIFENGKYIVQIIASNEEDKTKLIDILVNHTGIPYEENLNIGTNSSRIFIGEYFTEKYENQALYINNDFYFCYKTIENRDALFNNFSQKLATLPKDKIVLDASFGNNTTNIIDEELYELVISAMVSNGNREKNENSFFESASKFFKAIIQFFTILEIDNDSSAETLISGGFNLITPNSEINRTISQIYKIIYPLGFLVMLICWGFGMAKSTISASLDIKDRSSILNSVISLIIGLAAMSLSPQILTVLTGISKEMCETIGNIDLGFLPISDTTNIFDLILDGSEKVVSSVIVFLFIDLIFIINILWLALLQCLSPIFIGLMANTNTRKFSFNFIKEYFKALLIPIVTICYWYLVSAFQGGYQHLDVERSGLTAGLIGSIILALSTVSIAGKKLDKLIN